MPNKSKGSNGASFIADNGREPEVLRLRPSLRNSALKDERTFKFSR